MGLGAMLIHVGRSSAPRAPSTASLSPMWMMNLPACSGEAGRKVIPMMGACRNYRWGKKMSDPDPDPDAEPGPVGCVVVAFPAGQANFTGEMVSKLRALMGSNTGRVLDLLLVTKDVDGSVEASVLRDAHDSDVGQLRVAEADLAVLLAASDVDEIGSVLEPGSTAAGAGVGEHAGGNIRVPRCAGQVASSWPAPHPGPGHPGRTRRRPRRQNARNLTCPC